MEKHSEDSDSDLNRRYFLKFLGVSGGLSLWITAIINQIITLSERNLLNSSIEHIFNLKQVVLQIKAVTERITGNSVAFPTILFSLGNKIISYTDYNKTGDYIETTSFINHKKVADSTDKITYGIQNFQGDINTVLARNLNHDLFAFYSVSRIDKEITDINTFLNILTQQFSLSNDAFQKIIDIPHNKIAENNFAFCVSVNIGEDKISLNDDYALNFSIKTKDEEKYIAGRIKYSETGPELVLLFNNTEDTFKIRNLSQNIVDINTSSENSIQNYSISKFFKDMETLVHTITRVKDTHTSNL